MWETIFKSISDATGIELVIRGHQSLSGGCTNQSYRVETDDHIFFVKRHQEVMAPMFQAEFEALKELESTQTIKVPTPICWGAGEGHAWLVTSFLDLKACKGDALFELGRQLASLHKIQQPYFGWKRDNTIGITKQPNPPSRDWVSFWRTHRLEWQFKLARDKGQSFSGADALLNGMGRLFDHYDPQPSLIHGDLWSGNIAALSDATPVIFDPAGYYGDPEAEFGIIEMFGGFGRSFFQGYESMRPQHAGFSRRLPLYRLYHELNHYNLFGPSYTSSCQSSIQQLLDLIQET
ncbi:MAG TPA: fructosamine kinase family protein [Verrucomicrobiales bacterium]|nr:fructosamine kinase family protein [Verrucomicrobiales bacterium]